MAERKCKVRRKTPSDLEYDSFMSKHYPNINPCTKCYYWRVAESMRPYKANKPYKCVTVMCMYRQLTGKLRGEYTIHKTGECDKFKERK